MKRFLVLLLILLFTKNSFATHIAGGELIYEYLGPGTAANTSKYKITMRLFRECIPPPTANGQNAAELNGESVRIVVYDAVSFAYVDAILLSQQFVNVPPEIKYISGSNPCIVGNPTACYQVGTYSGVKDLNINQGGYILTWVRYTRTNPIQNVNSNGNTGGTYTTLIPGTNQLSTGFNNSPKFAIDDPAIICKQTSFIFNFSATDADNDSLAYKFAPAYDGIVGTNSNEPNPFFGTMNGNPPIIPNTLQLLDLGYINTYSGASPLGSNVTINIKTGIVSGIAPATPGRYVVCVMVEEWRNGKLINRHRKDFLLIVGDCTLSAAALKPTYTNCNDLIFFFINESTNTSIISYLWDFGVTTTTTDTSSLPAPQFAYPDTGNYVLSLKVVATGGCVDSAKAIVRAYPGFDTKFTVDGKCFQVPILFKDASTATYGNVNSWIWNFGDPSTLADTSHSKDTAWKYPTSSATKILVQLITGSTKGCLDTSTQLIDVLDKPVISPPLADTLICSIDDLLLNANSVGTYLWTSSGPDIIQNPTSRTPTVTPKDTTFYYLTVIDQGCINRDTLQVNVLDFITVNAGLDTFMCKTDTIRLAPVSHALSYKWVASDNQTVAPVKFPFVSPLLNPTSYIVLANLGKCPATDTVLVNVWPYPDPNAIQPPAICYGARAKLNATFKGTNFEWSPTNTLLNPGTLTPIAGPMKTTDYYFTVHDTIPRHCPKPVTDTVTVVVLPQVFVNAGNDTTVVIGQPLQMNIRLTNADTLVSTYLWKPNIGLNRDTFRNPIAVLNATIDSIKYIVRATTDKGCFGEDDIWVRVFKSPADIFVPSAFTPNSDSKNDIFKPIPVGIINITYFNVYNRWGQLLYSTSEMGKGWNGDFHGVAQPAGTYVFMVQGIDYTKKTIFKKGTVVLIR